MEGAITAVIAAVVALVVGVGGWFATAWHNQRSARRTIRVEYLLSAYRRLDSAVERPLNTEQKAALESAIADIQLLGTAQQVALADAFSRDFEADRTVDARELLEDLRRTLRRELRLERTQERKVWLRIHLDGDLWAKESARIQANVPTPSKAAAHANTPALHSPAVDSSAIERIRLKAGQVAQDLTERTGLASDASLGKLAQHARERNLVRPQTAEAAEGLGVMLALATTGRKHVTDREADEFAALADGLLFTIRRETRAAGEA